MKRMLVVVFDSEAKAFEASRIFERFDEDLTIVVHGTRVIRKDSNGAVSVASTHQDFPLGTLGGISVGGLIGVLGGPVGIAVGMATGLLSGLTVDVAKARLGQDFIRDVEAVLTPGKTALVAAIDEDSTRAVDERMAALGGSVLRRDMLDLSNAAYDREMAAIGADFSEAAAAHDARRAERRRRLHAGMASLSETLHDALGGHEDEKRPTGIDSEREKS
jgi:uncharacterized membrane protein